MECKLKKFNCCPGSDIILFLKHYNLVVMDAPQGIGGLFNYNDDATLIVGIQQPPRAIASDTLKQVEGLLQIVSHFSPDECAVVGQDEHGIKYYRLWWD